MAEAKKHTTSAAQAGRTKPLAERLELEAAKAALEKRARGETLKRGEISAIDRYEKFREAELRERLLTECPQDDLAELFGIPRKTLQVLKANGLPFRKSGRRVMFNLYEACPWFWERARGRGIIDKQGSSGKSPKLEEWHGIRVDRARWELERDQKKYLLKADVEAREVDIARAFRVACELAGKTLAPSLDGLSVREQQALIDKYFNEKLRWLSGAEAER